MLHNDSLIPIHSCHGSLDQYWHLHNMHPNLLNHLHYNIQDAFVLFFLFQNTKYLALLYHSCTSKAVICLLLPCIHWWLVLFQDIHKLYTPYVSLFGMQCVLKHPTLHDIDYQIHLYRFLSATQVHLHRHLIRLLRLL